MERGRTNMRAAACRGFKQELEERACEEEMARLH